jgi:hypothetical protein
METNKKGKIKIYTVFKLGNIVHQMTFLWERRVGNNICSIWMTK